MKGVKHSKLFLQDPNELGSYTLHEALLSVCSEALRGGGMFAFVTHGGVQLLLDDPAFSKFMDKSAFELIVGIDEVTNPKALSKLNNISENTPNFSVSAFLHNNQSSLFHPKFCWFETEYGGKLVIGSGNLTFRGLRNNWEAFSVIDLNEAEFLSVVSTWEQWRILHANELKSVDDPEVIDKANLNIWKRKLLVKKGSSVTEQPSTATESELEADIEKQEDSLLWRYKDTDEVLVAEIPKSGDRWRQANFDKESFVNFFGAEPGDNSQRILLRNIDSEGNFGDIESRPSVSVKSENYRFELGAAAGLTYPDSEAPIGVFIKIAKRAFVYCLVMPSDDSYRQLQEELTNRWTGRSDRMKRLLIPLSELKQSTNELPIWTINSSN